MWYSVLLKSIDWNNNSMIDIRLYAWLTSPIINVHHHLDDWLHLGDVLTHLQPRSTSSYYAYEIYIFQLLLVNSFLSVTKKNIFVTSKFKTFLFEILHFVHLYYRKQFSTYPVKPLRHLKWYKLSIKSYLKRKIIIVKNDYFFSDI